MPERTRLSGRAEDSRRTPTPRGAEPDGGEQARGRVADLPTPEEAQAPDVYRSLYERMGWSQTETARRVGVSGQDVISNRVRGEKGIGGEAARALLWAVEHAEG